MKGIEIRIALLQSGYKNADVAAELKVARSTVGEVIHGRQRSRRIASRIAEITGHSIEAMWPGKYARSPARRRKRGVAA